MAYEIAGLKLTAKSSGDMSAGQYKAVALSSANDADGAVVVAARGGKLAGVWLGNSTAAAFDDYQVTGVAKLQAGDSSGGAAISRGTNVVASSQGCAVPTTAAGQYVIGQALEALGAATTGIISVQLMIGAIST